MLVTGCGRSGTKYTSILLKRCGLDLPHERAMGKDGICSWLFGAESQAVPWGPSPADYSFEHAFHLVRNPLSCIPSITTFSPSAWRYISCHVELNPSDPLILNAAKYWLHWNVMVEKKAHMRVKIEEMPDVITLLCDQVGAKISISGVRQIPGDLNTRRYGTLLNILDTTCMDLGLVRGNVFQKGLLSKVQPSYQDMTWQDLMALDPVLAEKIYNKALEYGYEYTAGFTKR